MKLIRVLLLLLVVNPDQRMFSDQSRDRAAARRGRCRFRGPVVGNMVHDGIDTAAEGIDMAPL